MKRRDERGAAAVEFALVMPILLMLVFAIISFGWLFAQDLALSNASRQTARYGVVEGNTCKQITQQAIDAAGPLVTLSASDVTVTRGATKAAAAATASPCTKDDDQPCTGSLPADNVYITVDFTAKVLVPVFPGMGNTMDLDGEGVFRCEFS